MLGCSSHESCSQIVLEVILLCASPQLENHRVNYCSILRRCGWWEASSDKKARSGQGPGRLQHQDAAPHPHRAAQRQSGQPSCQEPQEEGRRHGHHDLLPVGRQAATCVCMCACVCVCVWQTDGTVRFPGFVVLNFKILCVVWWAVDFIFFFLTHHSLCRLCMEKLTKSALCLDCRPTGVQCFM